LRPEDKVAEVHRRLLRDYGQPAWRRPLDPISELVSTILSQNTNDVNRDVAFNQKGPRIQAALRFITQERGELSLDFLADWPLEEARQWLTSMNGVGPKTAAIILLFALGRPAFPVDTHIHRVSKRLGLIGPRVSREKAHEELEALVAPEDYYAFHLNVIRHGREVCTSRKPRCAECCLRDLCEGYQRGNA